MARAAMGAAATTAPITSRAFAKTAAVSRILITKSVAAGSPNCLSLALLEPKARLSVVRLTFA